MIKNASRRAESRRPSSAMPRSQATCVESSCSERLKRASLCGIARPAWSHVSTNAEFPSACSIRNTGGSSPPSSASMLTRTVPADHEFFDLVDAGGGVVIADVDQRARVRRIEEQVAHQVGALRAGGAEPLHYVTDGARHLVREGGGDEREVGRRRDDERRDFRERQRAWRMGAGNLV